MDRSIGVVEVMVMRITSVYRYLPQRIYLPLRHLASRKSPPNGQDIHVGTTGTARPESGLQYRAPNIPLKNCMIFPNKNCRPFPFPTVDLARAIG